MYTDRTSTAALIAQDNAIAAGGENWSEHLYKYPLAVVGDVGQVAVNSGIALYNAVVPEAIEAPEIDRYAFMANSIEDYAVEHRAAVGFGSFLAGALIPGMAISKAMSLSATGAGAWGYAYRGIGLTNFGEKVAASAHKAAQLAATSSWDTLATQAAARSTFSWTMANAVTENVMIETAIYGLMNKHDYFENGWSPGWGIAGVTIGSGLVGWLK
jgi:hypothetical protein